MAKKRKMTITRGNRHLLIYVTENHFLPDYTLIYIHFEGKRQKAESRDIYQGTEMRRKYPYYHRKHTECFTSH